MTKARTLADFISDGNPLADGTISVAEVSGAAPLANPTFTGTVTSTGDIVLGDNDKAIFGAGSDLQIYHDGSNSYINDAGTGSLTIKSNTLVIADTDGDNMLVGLENGEARLYNNGSQKLATTATGIDVTGTAVTDGLTVAGNLSVDGGTIKLDGNYPVGTGNVALGDTALDSVVTNGDYNTAVGAAALTADTKGQRTVAIGASALESQNFTSATVSYNTAVGFAAGSGVTTGINNTLIGGLAGDAITTGGSNVALGTSALSANTTASNNTAVGYQSLTSNTTGTRNVGVGYNTLSLNTTANDNTSVGHDALDVNTTGASNTALGSSALGSNTTASNNTAVGQQAGYNNTTGTANTFIGSQCAFSNTSGSQNTFIGQQSGELVTTGSKNTIIGKYNGNQGGLDIRTSSNNIVLSDGDGNPRGYYKGAWNFDAVSASSNSAMFRNSSATAPNLLAASFTGATPNDTTSTFLTCGDPSVFRLKIFSNGNVVNSNNSYGSISDVKLKENIIDASSQWDDIKNLTVRKYSMKADSLDAPNMLGVIAQEVEAAGMGGLVYESPDQDAEMNDLGTVTKQVNYSILYMKAVKALQEAMTRIEALETKVTALEGA